MNIHDRLRFLRNQLNLTTRTFGASINLSCGAITNMEKGSRNITDRTVADICRAYGINRAWLVDGEEPMYEDVISGLDISEEVKHLTRQYNMLNESDKELIRNMINALYEKVAKPTQKES